MAETLTIICALQQQYGKSARELEILVEGFSRVLRHYPMDIVISAIEKFTLANPNIPAPADIERTINPPRPKPDWAVYIALKKKIHEGYYPLSDERQFLRDCEEYAKENLREENDAYNDAQKQIAQHRLAIGCEP